MAIQTDRSQKTSMFTRYRWTELGLFIIPFLILLLGATQLLIVTNADPHASLTLKNLPTIQGLLPQIGLVVVLFLVNLILSMFYRQADQMLLPLVGLLSGIGVLMATRLGPDVGINSLGSRQLLYVVAGLVICVVTLVLLRNITWMADYKYTFLVSGIILVGLTLVNSARYGFNGPTHDQLGIGSISFQPSELLKICIVIFFAAYLERYQLQMTKGGQRIGLLRLPPLWILGPIAIMLLVALGLFMLIGELGLALLVYGVFLSILYLGTNKVSYVAVSLIIFLILGFIGYMLRSYVRARFAVLSIDVVNWSPASDDIYQHGAYQIVQGLIALSSGGILGAGLGLGHPGIVPVIQSDMVWSALGEELGLAGLFAIIGIYLLIIYRGFRIASEATNTFSQLLAAGLTSIFAIQTLIIAAGNMKLFPLTGIPLPFLSAGGSSVIANYIIIGILLRISYNTAKERDETV